MKREIYNSLVAWKNKSGQKPLIIRGARQTGKTWLMKQFGKGEYTATAYFNFEENQRLKEIFKGDFNIPRIIRLLAIEARTTITPETLIIFDEIQESLETITSLKYFYENAPEYHIIAAGSLLGVALHSEHSFPVGKVEFMDLFPLNFSEFLMATDEDELLKLLEEREWEMVKALREKYRELLKQYYYVGGMPEAVVAHTAKAAPAEIRAIQQRILEGYEQDFSKHAPNEIVPRIRMLWNSIPAQLSKENRKFIYSHIKHGARAKEFEMALAWLTDCGLVHKVYKCSKPALPLKAYEDISSFKLFLSDVGLLGAMGNLDMTVLLEGNQLFQEFKGAMTEQYVLQQLVTHQNWITYYWSAEAARAEIDFLLQLKSKLIPVEVKAEENLKARSLRVFHDKFTPDVSVRTSLSDYRKEDWLINLPLYAIHQLENIV